MNLRLQSLATLNSDFHYEGNTEQSSTTQNSQWSNWENASQLFLTYILPFGSENLFTLHHTRRAGSLVRVREKFWPRRTRTSEPARRIKYTKVWHRNYPKFDVPLLRSSRRSLIRYRNRTEITVLIKCVNRSIVLYDFRDGAKVIQYILNIALIHE